MSKICCGITYSINDRFCQMCGKELIDSGNEEMYMEEELDSAFVPNEEETPKRYNGPDDATDILTSDMGNNATTVLSSANSYSPQSNYYNPMEQQQPNSNGIYNQPNGFYNPCQYPSDAGDVNSKSKPQKTRGIKVLSIVCLVVALLGLIVTLVFSYIFWINPSHNEYKGSSSQYEDDIDSEGIKL